MSMKIIMALVFWTAIIAMYIMYYNETKAKKNIILGITFPASHQKDEVVTKAVADYKKWSTITLALLTLAMIPSFFFGNTGAMFYLLTWTSLSMIIMTLPYVVANRKLRAYKLRENLKGKPAISADLKLSGGEIKAVSPYYSLIPFVISLVPSIYFLIMNQNNFLKVAMPSLIMSATILFTMVLHIFINRRKKDVVTVNTNINFALSDIRTKNWSKLFIGLNAIVSLFSLLFFATVAIPAVNDTVVTIGILVLCFVAVFVSIAIDLDTRKKQSELTRNICGEDAEMADQDDYWYFGMFYSNKNDNRLMIPDRVGTNTTVNMAKPLGKVIMVIALAAIVSLPAWGAYMYSLEKQAMVVEFRDDAIVAIHSKEVYNIPKDEIVSMETQDKAPKVKSRINGYSTDNVKRGLFTVEGYGTCEIFMSTNADEYSIIKTKDGTTYILGY